MIDNWDVVRALREIPDALERARAAEKVWKQREGVTQVRDEAINELLASGRMNQKAVREELGISKALISQIAKKGPGPERTFLGTGALTVALGGKVEAKDERPGPVVAQEDLLAYEHLRWLANRLGLEAEFEVIQPPGNVLLNRDNLIVICGPRLSPLIGQILESDPHLSFERDDDGWFLTDRTTGTSYRSPMDQDEPRDIAYFGRLPRPDGQGTFLYIAGIHAPGAPGVVHWLTTELPNIYGELKLRRFSTLIASEFDPQTREVVSSERITPYYRPDGA